MEAKFYFVLFKIKLLLHLELKISDYEGGVTFASIHLVAFSILRINLIEPSTSVNSVNVFQWRQPYLLINDIISKFV